MQCELSFACGTHARLGAQSAVNLLPSVIVCKILTLISPMRLCTKALRKVVEKKFSSATQLVGDALLLDSTFVPAILAKRFQVRFGDW